MTIRLNNVDMSNHQSLVSIWTKLKPTPFIKNTTLFLPKIEVEADTANFLS